MKAYKFIAIFIIWVVGLLGAATAWAHQTDDSLHITEIRPAVGEVEQLLSVSAEDLSHHLGLIAEGEFPNPQILEEGRSKIAAYLEEYTAVLSDQERCELQETEFIAFPGGDGRIHYRQLWLCPLETATLTLENRLMHNTPGGYRHFARIQVGDEIFPTVFDGRFPTYSVYLEPGGGEAEVERQGITLRYLWQGFLHILLGFDHILFVLALLFAVRRFRSLVLVVSAFTVGHSITLGLSALDIFTISDRIIEPLIALSIAYVAAQNILRSGKWRHVWTTALFFGLIHGFGFSYILRDEMSLPVDAALGALFAFNVGVELGQLLVVALAFPLVMWLRKNREKLFTGINRWVNAAIILAAVYWMVERVFFW